MSDALSIFDAADEVPDRIAVIDGTEQLTFRELARRAGSSWASLMTMRPPALALTPLANVESLAWLYAAFAAQIPVLTLHHRATAPERQHAMNLVGAVAPTDFGTSVAQSAPLLSDDTAPLVYIPTSGSTGTPRLVELSRGAVQASAHASAANLGWHDDDRWLACLPLAHTGGLSIVVRCLLARRAIVLFEAEAGGLLAHAARLAEVARTATLISLVPSVLERLLDSGFTPTPSLRAVLLGGSGCSPALARRAHAARIPLLTSYGLTETASQVVTRRYAERFEPLPERHGCVSSGYALPGVELQLRDGSIALRTASCLTRYVGAGSPLDAEGWLLTSDRGELGHAGELYVRGRSDDVIVTGGENVDPLEVEAALLTLPGVTAACVFGLPSPQFGAVVSVLLVASDATLADAPRLAELLASRLARHKQPRLVKLVESLPLTRSGKLDRRACAACFDESRR